MISRERRQLDAYGETEGDRLREIMMLEKIGAKAKRQERSLSYTMEMTVMRACRTSTRVCRNPKDDRPLTTSVILLCRGDRVSLRVLMW